jgi:hypothetical protein
MKTVSYKVSGFLFLIFLTALVSCASGPEQRGYDFIESESVDSVTVNYTVSDSAAFSLVQAWISEEIKTGLESITVNDSANGILAGKDVDYYFGVEEPDTITTDYKVIIKNGRAVLTSTVFGRGRWPGYSRDEAKYSFKTYLAEKLIIYATAFQDIF